MDKNEAIEYANALKNNYTVDLDKLPEFCDIAISALKPTCKIDESNFSMEQYRADLQSAYDCGKAEADEWIPVSERLPEDYDRVLITIDGCRGLIVREARYNKAQNEFKVLYNNERWEVGETELLAWQPLPKPCKGVSE